MPARIQKAIRRLTDQQKKIQDRFRLVSLFRTTTFFLSIALIFLFPMGEVNFLPSVPGWIVFLGLVRWHSTIRRKRTGCMNRIRFYESELSRLEDWFHAGTETGVQHGTDHPRDPVKNRQAPGPNQELQHPYHARKAEVHATRTETAGASLQNTEDSLAEEFPAASTVDEEKLQIHKDLLLTGRHSLFSYLDRNRLPSGRAVLHTWMEEALDGADSDTLKERQRRIRALAGLTVLQGRWYAHASLSENQHPSPAAVAPWSHPSGAVDSGSPESDGAGWQSTGKKRASRSQGDGARFRRVPGWLAILGGGLALMALGSFFSHEILGTRAYHLLAFPLQWLVFGLYLAFYRSKESRERFDLLLNRLDQTLPLLKEMHGFRFRSGELQQERELVTRLEQGLREAIVQDTFYSLFRNPLAFALGGLIFSGPVLADWSMGRFLQRKEEDVNFFLSRFAELDALFSLAIHMRFQEPCAIPELENSSMPLLQASNLHHPLLPARTSVGNDVDFKDRNRLWIVTGSNMGGKSTFLRTVGMNLVLAQMGTSVRAHSFRFRPTPLATSMQIQDNLSRSESLFFAEVRSLKRLVDRKPPLFYFLDEMLKGTNQKDRSFACRKILAYLIRSGASGFLTTHDMELTSLKEEFGDSVELYHFREAPGEGLHFDFKLHPGSVEGTTALAILRQEGLPV